MTDTNTDHGGAVALLPCPFCGSAAVFARDSDEDGSFVAVQCTGCGCGSGKHYPIMDSADANAANEWNRRHPTPQTDTDAREKVVEASARLAKFVLEWSKGRANGDEIYGLHPGDEREASLSLSDLRTILAALKTGDA